MRRDKKCKDIDNLSTSQFWKMYGTAWKKKEAKQKSIVEEKLNKLSLKQKRKENTAQDDSDSDIENDQDNIFNLKEDA